MLTAQSQKCFLSFCRLANYQTSKCLCTSSVNHRKTKHFGPRPGRILEMKFLQRDAKRAEKGPNSRIMPLPGSGVGSEFRNKRLENILLLQISDIMSTSDIGTDLFQYGVSITKVEVTSKLSQIRVYWACMRHEYGEQIDQLIKSKARPLKRELQELRIMSTIPEVVFVREEKNQYLAEIDRRLAIADLGEDFEPTDRTYYQRSEYILNKRIDPQLWEKLKELSNEENPKSEEENEFIKPENDAYANQTNKIPSIANDVNHVHWDKIMDKILHNIDQNKALHRLDYFSPQPTKPQFQSQRVSRGPIKGIDEIITNLNKKKLRRERTIKTKRKYDDLDDFICNTNKTESNEEVNNMPDNKDDIEENWEKYNKF